MPRLSLIFGGVFVVTVLGARLLGYFEGLHFEKYWSGLLLVPLCLGSFLGYLAAATVTVIAAIRKKVRWVWVPWVLSVPALVVGSYAMPIPSFTDGMHDAVKSKVKEERLLRFAEAAGALQIKPDLEETNDPRIELMMREYSEIYGLSAMAPRIDKGKDYVDIFWGSALVQHWGIRIGRKPFIDAPADYQKGVSCREVYRDIWVYHDRY